MLMMEYANVEKGLTVGRDQPAAALLSRFARWRDPLLAFFMGQPAVQLLNLVTGFLLVRWLDVEQFAMLGIALAFQSTVAQLTDLGFSGSIIALAGERGHDAGVLGGYLRSARHWRSRMQGVTLLVAAVAFPWVVWSQPWSAAIKGLLFVTIALGVLFQSWSMYGAPLLVNRSLRRYYAPQIQGALLRLALCAALHAAGLLSSWVAALLTALVLGYTGLSYRRSARSHIREPQDSQPECNAEMLRYLSPLIPGVVFASLQGQILVGIMAVFGSTRNIAEVSALGRLGQLFVILGAFNAVFIEPYIARVPRTLLVRRYLQILGVALGIAGVIAVLGFLFPRPLLWLLGHHYAGLEREVGWVVLTASLGYIGGVMWTMHAARKWVFWWGTGVYIATLLITQSLCIAYMDLSQTLSVVWFGLITSVVVIIVHVATGIYGFRQHSVGESSAL